jgi:hypothetical protein
MAPRLTAAIAVGAATCLAIAGCGDGDPQATGGPDPPASYVAAVDALLKPPAQLASAVQERARDLDAPAPARERLERLVRLVRSARARLADLRALRLQDAGLRRHRDRLAAAYARLVPRMPAVVAALAGGDRAALEGAATPFLDALRTLPSGAAASSSR